MQAFTNPVTRLAAPTVAMIFFAACLIDVDIADNRRTELEQHHDSGSIADSGHIEHTDVPSVDCSGVVLPAPVGDVVMVRSSGKVTCLLKTGSEKGAHCDAPEDPELVEAIAGIPYHSIGLGRRTFCGIRSNDRSIECTGVATDVVDSVPSGAFSAVALTRDPEGDTACALGVAGDVTCWGDDTFGLVTGAPTEDMCSVTMAQHHACGIRANGTLVCWGSGTEAVAGAAVPSGTYRDVTVGRDFACAVSSTGDLSCWGDKASWTEDEAVPSVEARWVGAANHFGCTLTDTNTLTCWGPAPDDIPTDEEFEQITGANHGICAVRSDETTECWRDAPGAPPQ